MCIGTGLDNANNLRTKYWFPIPKQHLNTNRHAYGSKNKLSNVSKGNRSKNSMRGFNVSSALLILKRKLNAKIIAEIRTQRYELPIWIFKFCQRSGWVGLHVYGFWVFVYYARSSRALNDLSQQPCIFVSIIEPSENKSDGYCGCSLFASPIVSCTMVKTSLVFVFS
jgi:hypothetical protein